MVPVRNDAERLRKLLQHLDGQTVSRDQFEVVVGDDGSTDLDPALVGTDDGRVRVVRQPRRNSFAARNLAASHSSGEVLAFTDADCEPEPDWLERGLEALAEADLVGGMIKFRLPERVTVWAMIDMETFLDQERNVRGGGVLTANAFVDRQLFERVGGFDESLPLGGDIVFGHECRVRGGRLAFAPSCVVWHPPRAEAGSLLRKVWAVEHAYACRYVSDRLPRPPLAARWRTLLPFLGVIRARLRSGIPVLDRNRLAANGASPTWLDDLKAVPILYILLPFLRAAAETAGWWQGRRVRARST